MSGHQLLPEWKLFTGAITMTAIELADARDEIDRLNRTLRNCLGETLRLSAECDRLRATLSQLSSVPESGARELGSVSESEADASGLLPPE